MSKLVRLKTKEIKHLRDEPLTFERLFSLCMSHGNLPFIRYVEDGYIKEVTYGREKERALATAQTIKKKVTLPKNSIIALAGENSRDWISAFWGILAAGYRPYLVNMHHDENTISRLLSSLNISLVIGERTFDGIPFLPYDEIVHEMYVEEETTEPWGQEVLLSSSGTSNLPKVYAFSSETLCLQIENEYYLGRPKPFFFKNKGKRPTHLAILPFYHIFGLCAVFIWYSWVGATFMIPMSLVPMNLAESIHRGECNLIFAVPNFYTSFEKAILAEVAKKDEKTQKKFEKGIKISLKLQAIFPRFGRWFAKKAFKEVRRKSLGERVTFMITGGGYIPENTLQLFNALGYRFVNGYGMTEIGIASVEVDSLKERISGSVGKPMKHYEYILEETNAQGIGKLYVKSDTMFDKQIVDGKEEIRDKSALFFTGDLAKCVKGKYYLFGRDDDVVVHPSGELISPSNVENHFTHEGIKSLAFIYHEINILFIQFEANISLKEKLSILEDLKSINVKLNPVFQIAAFKEATSIPMAMGFKISYRKLLNDYLANPTSYPLIEEEKEYVSDDLLGRIIHYFSVSTGVNESLIKPDTSYATIGSDSIAYYSMVYDMSTEFEKDNPLLEGLVFQTPEEFHKYYQSKEDK
ncbi:MAG: acyl--CoA ligase [Bacilli bacterium]|nr:acyl--CoA ligase [Bacilli bacterium]